MNKKKLVMFGLPTVLAIIVVSAIIFSYVSVDATVNEALSSTTVNLDLSGFPGETITKSISIDNKASVDLPVLLTWIEKVNKFSLDNLLGTCMPYPSVTCEKKIVIDQLDLNFSDLVDLETISWDAEVFAGYLPHVDVFLDNGETLTFEYAKVDPSKCDNAPYPTGTLNTFDDKGIIDDSAHAWLSSGPAGPCGDSTFDAQHKSLADWKAIYSTAVIEKIEVEIDNWIAPSKSDVWSIKVNGVEIGSVLYTTDLPKTVNVVNGANSIDVSFTYTTDTEPGKLSGRILLERII